MAGASWTARLRRSARCPRSRTRSARASRCGWMAASAQARTYSRRSRSARRDYAMRMKILILGASYGSLLGVKIALAGHDVTLVCLPQEAALINSKGAIVRMPVKGREGLVEVNSRNLKGKLNAVGTDVDP